MNLDHEVEQLKDELIEAVQGCIRIKSVKGPGEGGAPFGRDIQECLDWTLALGKDLGFTVKNTDGYAGHIEMGSGKLIGILGHLDVVPEGDGWTVPPYGGVIKEGKIYGRGATDDKGPSIAALFAMKAVMNAGVPLNKRIRLILGTDEESGWADLDYYFKHEELPEIGFAPDAEFPLIHAEKGILHFELAQSTPDFSHLVLIEGGERANVVPDLCKIVLKNIDFDTISCQLAAQTWPAGVSGQIADHSEKEITLLFKGLSAHGSLPQNGLNAVLYGIKFLQTLSLDENEQSFLQWITEHPGTGFYGEGFGIPLWDEPSGKLSSNLGIFSFKDSQINMVIDIRYPVTYSGEDILSPVGTVASAGGYTLKILSHQKPHHVPKDSPLVESLLKAYEKVTGKEGYAMAIGGGTYAKALPQGVAFGPVMPGEPEVIHCPDEYIGINDLLLCTKVYAQAIYNLLTDI